MDDSESINKSVLANVLLSGFEAAYEKNLIDWTVTDIIIKNGCKNDHKLYVYILLLFNIN